MGKIDHSLLLINFIHNILTLKSIQYFEFQNNKLSYHTVFKNFYVKLCVSNQEYCLNRGIYGQ